MDRPPAIRPVSGPKKHKTQGARSPHGIRGVFAQHQIIADAAEPFFDGVACALRATPPRQVSVFQ